ncbi:hypothetical protein B0H16DRAFT_1343360, partial [Mycena metata]
MLCFLADKIQQILNDSPFKQHCDNNAEVWKFYLTSARRIDDQFLATLNNDLDPLLIFTCPPNEAHAYHQAGLFSAILTAFLIEGRKRLREDPQETTNNLLKSLIEGQHTDDPPFKPAMSSRWVNGLWFMSLIFTLTTALGASVAKYWTTHFSTTRAGSGWSNAQIHSRVLCGIQRWQLKPLIQFLPLLLHIAFFLFGVGLGILLFHDDKDIGIIILILVAFVTLVYI